MSGPNKDTAVGIFFLSFSFFFLVLYFLFLFLIFSNVELFDISFVYVLTIHIIFTSLPLGDVIQIKVGNKGPYGMELVADRYNCGLIISSWARLADGKFGAIQKHGK